MRFLVLLYILIHVSCSGIKENKVDKLNNLFERYNNLTDLKFSESNSVVILVTYNQCHFCLEKMTNYYSDNKIGKNISLILSSSEKDRISFASLYDLNYSDILIDDRLAYKMELVKEKPLVLLIKDDIIIQSFRVIPDNYENVIRKMSKHLSTL